MNLKSTPSAGRRLASSVLSVATALSGVTAPVSQAAAQSVQRPPQFVLMAFDGSQSHDMWTNTRQFAKDMDAQGKHVRFTYFISGVYYVSKKNKTEYTAPHHGNSSAIGWGEDAKDLLGRYDQTNGAFAEGHEIASHANGHWDAYSDGWTQEEWDDEFKQFNKLIFGMLEINNLTPTKAYPTGWLFGKKDIVGFRAPQLGINQWLWPVLEKYKFRYDTSKTSSPNYWPQRNEYGTWNFPLATLRVAGTGKSTLSMDYNFYVAQTNARPDPANSALYEKQMYETYLQYFQSNYNGVRAPIHIGHHFSLWNGGAYWKAMKRFAEKVCGLPEVKCVTYKELADFMDATDAQTLAAYKAGSFPKTTPVSVAANTLRPLDLRMNLAMSGGRLNTAFSGRDAMAIGDKYRTVFTINGHRIDGQSFSLAELRNLAGVGREAVVSSRIINKNGVEVFRQTHKMVDVGLDTEELLSTPEEARALIGDLPEAHLDEMNQDGMVH